MFVSLHVSVAPWKCEFHGDTGEGGGVGKGDGDGGTGGGGGACTPVTEKATKLALSSSEQNRAHVAAPVSSPGQSYRVLEL